MKKANLGNAAAVPWRLNAAIADEKSKWELREGQKSSKVSSLGDLSVW